MVRKRRLTPSGEGRNLSFRISVDAVDQFQVETSGPSFQTLRGIGEQTFTVESPMKKSVGFPVCA